MPPSKKNTPQNYAAEYAKMPYDTLYKELITIMQKLEKQDIRRVEGLENIIDKVLALSEACDQRLREMQEKVKLLEIPLEDYYD